MTIKKTLLIAKNKQTGFYLGIDESGEPFDLDANANVIAFMHNLFWFTLEEWAMAKLHVEENYPGYELVKAQIVLTVKEIT